MTDAQLTTNGRQVKRVAFLGTPPAAATCLTALVEAGFEVPVVITQPDRRRGRGSTLVPSPVKIAAVELGLPVKHDPRDVLDVDVDLAVVVAFGRILRNELLDRVDFLNVHFSILPRWRGAAPVECAILAGDATSGVCLMKITEGLDEGPVYGCREVEIGENESAEALTERLADLGARLLVEILSEPLAEPVPQSGPATHAGKLDRSHNELDFALPAIGLHRRVRIGRAWTIFRGDRLVVEETRIRHDPLPPEFRGPIDNGELVVVDEQVDAEEAGQPDRPSRLRSILVGTGDGLLELVTVKPAGRRSMCAVDWFNGVHYEPGERLGH